MERRADSRDGRPRGACRLREPRDPSGRRADGWLGRGGPPPAGGLTERSRGEATMEVMVPGSATETRSTTGEEQFPHREVCCTHYHRAVELIGKRWTGAIVFVLMDGPLRFSEIKQL